jgi:signal transduction histidine kinase
MKSFFLKSTMLENDKKEAHQGPCLHRTGIVMVAAFGVSTAAMLTLFPYFHSTVFSASMFPAVCGGWLLGFRKGFFLSLLSVAIALLCQIILEHDSGIQYVQALFGGPVVIFAGLAVGRLRDLGKESKIAVRHQLDAEEGRQKLERQLQQSQKMEAVGTLAGGVAHDMNNILGIIMSSASVLKHNMKHDAQNLPDIDNILSACRRGRDLTRNLLGFARKGSYVKEMLDLNDIVEEVTRLIAPIIRKNIGIETRIAGDLHPIHGDRSQIAQVLLNVCINASEAISSAGTIVITTRNATATDRALTETYHLAAEDYVAVQVADNGSGIDPETLRHVFEPFFTTKRQGEGTGLGLAMAYGAVKNHGGCIDIESTVGRGTTLTMILPAVASLRRVKAAQRNSTPPIGLFPGSILLVDDEPLIRTANQRLLRQLGFSVIPAESGEEALKIYETLRKQIVLIILDYVMPKMDGAETFSRLKALDPDVKVVISSGYSKDGVIDAILDEGAIAFIQKPFDSMQLRELLSKISTQPIS